MKRVLMLASVASMIERFNMSNIELLQSMGYQVDVACNFVEGNGCSDERIEAFKQHLEQANIPYYQIDFSRKVRNIRENGKAYRQVKTLLQNNQYEFLHCHSPIGGVVGRVAGKRTGTKVIYTAHGFHFYKGAPALNWMVYYPIERFLSRWTDVLITINQEDYQRAKEHFHMKQLEYIPGVGVDIERFSTGKLGRHSNSIVLRQEFHLTSNDKVLMYVAELNKNKNQISLLKMTASLCKQRNDIKLMLVGAGAYEAVLQKQAKELDIADQVIFTGYRDDVPNLLQIANVYVASSIREGLAMNVIEAMASGVPVVAFDNRGHRSIIEDGVNGYLVKSGDDQTMAEKVKELLDNKNIYQQFSEAGQNRVSEFAVDNVMSKMKTIYFGCV